MSSISNYLNKQNFKSRISTIPGTRLKFIVVIPCHDEPDLEATLLSLEAAASSHADAVEIILVVNDAADHPPSTIENNRATVHHLQQRKNTIPIFTIYETRIASKIAGVGHARKIGMDEAANRFDQIGIQTGIICSMDADSLVQENYFEAISVAFKYNSRFCKTIYFEHEIGEIMSPEHQVAMIQYELHLRYYIHALRYAGFPHAYQTLGSAFCVRADRYAAVGGMPQRQAGEDFYFIHKFSKIDQVSEVRATTVRPSSRVSHRVPFGTGRAMQKALLQPLDLQSTYPLEAFKDLRQFLAEIQKLYVDELWTPTHLAPSLQSFLTSVDFQKLVIEIRKNSTGIDSFKKRFFQKMDAFMMMKYVHFARDRYYGTDSLYQSAGELLSLLNILPLSDNNPMTLLETFRLIDRRME